MTTRITETYYLDVIGGFLKISFTDLTVQPYYLYMTNLIFQPRDEISYIIKAEGVIMFILDYTKCLSFTGTDIYNFLDLLSAELVLPTGSGGGGGISADVNLIKVDGNAVNAGSGTIGTGTLRVTIGTNDPLTIQSISSGTTLTSINTNLTNIGTTSSSNYTLLTKMGTTMTSIDTQLYNTGITTGIIGTKLNEIGTTTSSNNVLLYTSNVIGTTTNLLLDTANQIGITANVIGTTTNILLDTANQIGTTTNILLAALGSTNSPLYNIIPMYDNIPFKINNSAGYVSGNRLYTAELLSSTKEFIASDYGQFCHGCNSAELYGSIPTSPKYLYLPPSATTIQIASTSTADSNSLGTGARTVTIYGINSSYIRISEDINMNGQTPATTVQSFLRVFKVVIKISGNSSLVPGSLTPIGHVNWGPGGSVFTAGLIAAANFMGSIDIGLGASKNGTITIPPYSEFFITNISISSTLNFQGNSGGWGEIDIMAQSGNSGWKRISRYVTTDSNPVVNINHISMPTLTDPDRPELPTDIYLQSRADSNLTIHISAYISGIIVKPIS